MPWTRHDKDDTTLQNVGSHFRDTAVPHPTKLVSCMWKVVFWSIWGVIFSHGETKENHKKSHSWNVYGTERDHGIRAEVLSTRTWGSSRLLPTRRWCFTPKYVVVNVFQICWQRQIHSQLKINTGAEVGAEDDDDVQGLLRNNNTDIPLQMNAYQTQMDQETESTLYPLSYHRLP